MCQIDNGLTVNHRCGVTEALIFQAEMSVRISVPAPECVTQPIEFDDGIHQHVPAINLSHIACQSEKGSSVWIVNHVMVAIDVRKISCQICLQIPKVRGCIWFALEHQHIVTDVLDGRVRWGWLPLQTLGSRSLD